MNSAVKIITGWRKLVAPPVAHRERATIGMVVAVTTARQPTVIVRPRDAIHSENRPHPTPKAAIARAIPTGTPFEAGSTSTTAPSRPVAVHIPPDVRSGRGPSSHGLPSAWS